MFEFIKALENNALIFKPSRDLFSDFFLSEIIHLHLSLYKKKCFNSIDVQFKYDFPSRP